MKNKLKKIGSVLIAIVDILAYIIMFGFVFYYLVQAVNGYKVGDYNLAFVSAVMAIPFILCTTLSIHVSLMKILSQKLQLLSVVIYNKNYFE